MAGFVNLVKLCVGTDRVEELLDWQQGQSWPGGHPVHVTRMWPKRADELLAGGSLYWVFRGVMLARQRLVALEEVRGGDGIRRCALVLEAEVIRTAGAPRRPFQGWRYLEPADAPHDLVPGRAFEAALPDQLARALADIGLR